MKKLSFLSLLLLFLVGCREDVNEITNSVTTVTPPVIITDYVPVVDLVTGTVVGVIYDENKDPVDNATISLRGQTYTTDEAGRFLAKNVELDSEGTFFTVEKDGYFKGSRRFFPQAEAVSYAVVELLPINSIGKFSAEEGATLSTDNGLQIIFPSNAIKQADGTLYTGVVDVAAQWLDPSADNVYDIMPGSLQGISTQLEEVSMATYGMMAVELFDTNGNLLNIADGKTAELSFPLPDDFLTTAPAEIPLWSFEDQTYGLWVQEGSASLVGNRYVGNVSHFSFWNCDAPFPIVTITGRVVTEDGTPLTGKYVGVCVENSTIAGGGYTNEDGVFTGKMPKDEVLIFKLYQYSACQNGTITYTYGPFSSDTDIGDIVLSSVVDPYSEISGSVVDCNGDPITEAWVSYSFDNGYSFSEYLSGSNEFNLVFLDCGNYEEISIEVVDLVTLEVGPEQTYSLTPPTTDVGILSACGSTLDYYFTLTIDGESKTFPNAGAFLEDPAGNQWLYIHVDSLGGSWQSSFNITLQDGSVGSSDASNVNSLFIAAEPPAFVSNYFLNCQGSVPTCVSEITVNVTTNTGSGGLLEGNLNGIADFEDGMNGTISDIPFSANFKLEID